MLGTKAYAWNTTGGMPQTRVTLISKFVSANGFQIVFDIMTAPDSRWPGGESARSIVHALVEVSSFHQ